MKTRPGQNAAFTEADIEAHSHALKPSYLTILRAAATRSCYVDLADGLGLPKGTVKSRLSRARKVLNREIARETARSKGDRT